jgi:3-phosphoshikimate 1-carboxyvinyltransferase
LLRALIDCGASCRFESRPFFAPFSIKGPLKGADIRLRATVSSQFVSALLMVLPLTAEGGQLLLEGELVSRTYVDMTLACLASRGVHVHWHRGEGRFSIPGGQSLSPRTLEIEPDASTASYFAALPAMLGGRVFLFGLKKESFQGDIGFFQLLEAMGMKVSWEAQGVSVERPEGSALKGLTVDMNTMSDVAPTLAMVATRAVTPTRIVNIANMRLKECDRISVLAQGLRSVGVQVDHGADWLTVHPVDSIQPACLDPFEDHRMAMSFTLLGLCFGGIAIQDASCVDKTVPRFYEMLNDLLQPRSTDALPGES